MKNIIFSGILLGIEIITYWILSILLEIHVDIYARAMCIYIMLMIGNRHYERNTNLIWDEIKVNCRVMLFHALLILVMLGGLEDTYILIKMLLIASVMTIISILLNRYLRILARKQFRYRTVIIGDGWAVNRYLDIAKNNRFTLIDIKAVVSARERLTEGESYVQNGESGLRVRKYGLDDLDMVLSKTKADHVVVLMRGEDSERSTEVMRLINGKVQRIQSLVEGGGIVTFASKIQDFDGILLCTTSGATIGYGARIFKRTIDIFAGLVGCMISVALYYKVKKSYRAEGDMAPVIFTQERIGRYGKPIKIYKIRTMIENAEEKLEELMENDPMIKHEYLTNKKLENDPRVTKLGDRLRRTSLDEFPQFWNVLKGEMSLVGPRPYLYREKEDMGIYFDSIVSCKPGITGMWQANGRSDVAFEERCRYDDYYYKNWSFIMEFIIIYKTIKGVIYGKGAM